MEKLDKEALAQIHVKQELSEMEGLGFSYGDIYSSIESSYKAGLEYAENYYLKLIEEKDKILDDRERWAIDLITEKDFVTIELQLCKESKFANDAIIRNLQSELQQAKELLKEAQEAMGSISYKHKQFFSKQKIEEFLKQ